ncbi:MAG: hypothetical protein ACYCT0_12125 [Sulfobacillus sp.]
MPNQYKPGTTSLLVRLPQTLKDRLYAAADRMTDAYGVKASAQDIVRRAIEEACERIEQETARFTQEIKHKY